MEKKPPEWRATLFLFYTFFLVSAFFCTTIFRVVHVQCTPLGASIEIKVCTYFVELRSGN